MMCVVVRGRWTHVRLLALLLAPVAALFLLLPNASVQAHGGGTPRLTNTEAGPYRLFAWTQPEPWRAGEVHISIAVTLPPPSGAEVDESVVNNQLEQPVTDAQVRAVFTPVGGAGNQDAQPITVVATSQELLNNFYYEVDTVLPAAGEWQVEIQVDGPLGQGHGAFAVAAGAARTLNWPLIVGVAVLFLLLLLWAAQRGRQRPARPQSRVRPATQ